MQYTYILRKDPGNNYLLVKSCDGDEISIKSITNPELLQELMFKGIAEPEHLILHYSTEKSVELDRLISTL